MRSPACLMILVSFVCFTVSMSGTAAGDVAPGDILDKSNWENAQGLLPEAVLNWVKNGDMTMAIDQLEYDPREYVPAVARKSYGVNQGIYEVDAEDMIIEASTGKPPKFIEGVPFPEETDIDMEDPKAGTKIMYNKFYHTYSAGNQKFPFGTVWVSRNHGFEREVKCEWQQYPLNGFPGHKNQSNREGYERFALIRVLAPFDIAGTNILLMRYLDKKADTTLAYVPAIRRVRRMSPANRSDSFIGSDCCVDDAWCFDGKVSGFSWKLLRKQESLLPFLDTKVLPLEKNGGHGWVTGKNIKQIRYGYEEEGWQGSPWMATNLIWVKRPTYVIEMKPKDPYYNYGTQYVWIDAEVNWMIVWKIIYDRADKYWKVVWYSYGGAASPDDQTRLITGTSMQCIDDRTGHGTIIRFPEPKNQWAYGAKLNKNDYSLGGFQKLCK